METSNVTDYDAYWTASLATYRSHPTSRHRRRFAKQAIRKEGVPPNAFVFDYGCGPGLLLKEIQDRYGLADAQLGGCDLSIEAIKAARKLIQSPYFYHEAYPELEHPIDIAITTEVIEHTSHYEDILTWLWRNLRDNGALIVTTAGGTMDPPDVHYGHVQHFRLRELRQLLERLGFSLRIARCWGFPLFTLQKWITKRNFDNIQKKYMIGDLNTKKRLIFYLAYALYFLHDLFPWGPQIFILAKKDPLKRRADL